MRMKAICLLYNCIEFQRNNPTRFIRFDCSKVYKCSDNGTMLQQQQQHHYHRRHCQWNGNGRRVHLILSTMHANKCRLVNFTFFLTWAAVVTLSALHDTNNS